MTNGTGSPQRSPGIVHGNHELQPRADLLQRLLEAFEVGNREISRVVASLNQSGAFANGLCQLVDVGNGSVAHHFPAWRCPLFRALQAANQAQESKKDRETRPVDHPVGSSPLLRSVSSKIRSIRPATVIDQTIDARAPRSALIEDPSEKDSKVSATAAAAAATMKQRVACRHCIESASCCIVSTRVTGSVLNFFNVRSISQPG